MVFFVVIELEWCALEELGEDEAEECVEEGDIEVGPWVKEV